MRRRVIVDWYFSGVEIVYLNIVVVDILVWSEENSRIYLLNFFKNNINLILSI